MIPTSQPNAAQKRWMEAVRELGSVISGEPAVIHHPAGRKAKHNKVDIGHWWLIPLTDDEHKSLHNGGKPWSGMYPESQTRKQFEKAAYMTIAFYLADYIPLDYLPPQDVERAILDYHR